jgi:hypothetical protein
MIELQRLTNHGTLGGFSGSAYRKKLKKLIEYFYEDAGAVDFKPKSRQIWKPAKEYLRMESYGKCAYCEAPTSVVAHGDVEHFRPKSQYWWLAYSYVNYTFSCQICNQTYKGDKFPYTGSALAPPKLPRNKPSDESKIESIAESFALEPSSQNLEELRGYFAREKSHLPDPYLADPEALFAWRASPETKEVFIAAKGDSVKAKRAFDAVESVLGLNRKELLNLRWLEYEQLEIQALVLAEEQLPEQVRKRLLKSLELHSHPERAFAGMKRYFLRQWGVI